LWMTPLEMAGAASVPPHSQNTCTSQNNQGCQKQGAQTDVEAAFVIDNSLKTAQPRLSVPPHSCMGELFVRSTPQQTTTQQPARACRKPRS
jgi:hypothetical protein